MGEKKMNQTIKRWQVLYASTTVLLCTGAIYAFSVFASPLSQARGWSMSEIMLAFTINAAIGPIPNILGGYFTDKGWAKWTIFAGGLLFAFGFILTGLSTSTTMLYISYGVIAGLGQGFAYSGCLSNTIRLFPDKRGLASGLITAGMGGAAIIAAPVANMLIQELDVLYAFQIMGGVYLVIVIIASFFIRNAPANYAPEGWTPPSSKGSNITNKNWQQMLKTKEFYFIIAMLSIGSFSGLMIASNASVIGQGMFSLTAQTAALYVSFYSLSNCLGRVIWGSVSDKIGRTKTLLIIYSVIALSLLSLATISSVIGFTIGIIGLGLCFGGVMGVFPSIVMENYGPVNQGVNYGIVFAGYSIAAFYAPRVAASIATANNGDFTNAFYVAIVLAAVGLVLDIIYIRFKEKEGK
jgi:OFA family oxalate/formate antiporter-like MFS transporter